MASGIETPWLYIPGSVHACALYMPFMPSREVNFPMEKEAGEAAGRFPQIFHLFHFSDHRLTKTHGFSEVSQSSTTRMVQGGRERLSPYIWASDLLDLAAAAPPSLQDRDFAEHLPLRCCVPPTAPPIKSREETRVLQLSAVIFLLAP